MAEFRYAPRAVMVFVVCWTITYEAAETLVRSYEDGEWSLGQKLGMIVRRGERQPIYIKDYVTKVLPEAVSQQAAGTL